MKIQSIRAYRFELPLAQPLVLRGGTLESRSGVVLQITSDSGDVGWGEASPLPGFSRETLEQVVERAMQLPAALGEIDETGDPADSSGISKRLMAAASANRAGVPSLPPSLAFGIEMAALNLLARSRGVALCGLLSPSPRERVSVNGLLAGPRDEACREASRLREAGYRAVKLKVGRTEVSEDVQTVRLVRQVLGEDVALRLDANRAWDYDSAMEFARGVAGCPIDYIEEPLSDPSRLMRFAADTGLPVALDETVVEQGGDRLERWRGAAAVILKPTLLGGIEAAWRVARQARELGMTPVLSSSFESGLGLVALAHAAAAMYEDDVPVGLDTGRWFQFDILDGVVEARHGQIDIATLDEQAGAIRESCLEELGPVAPSSHSYGLRVLSEEGRGHPQGTKTGLAGVTGETAFVANAFQNFADRPAVIAPQAAWTFREYRERAWRIAGRLDVLGFREGDRLAIALPPCPTYLATLMACLKRGIVACPMSTRLPPEGLNSALAALSPRALLTDIPREISGIQTLFVSDLGEESPCRESGTPHPPAATPNEHPTAPVHVALGKSNARQSPSASAASVFTSGGLQPSAFSLQPFPGVIVFTSGSSGAPKPALLTIGNLFANAAASNRNIPVGPGDRWLLSLPLHHVSGLGVVFRCLLGGAAIVIPGPDENFAQAISQHRVTHLSLVPTQLYRMLDDAASRSGRRSHLQVGSVRAGARTYADPLDALRRLKAILLGGSAVPDALIEQAIAHRLPIFRTYGLTETASQVTTTRLADPPGALFTSGKPLDSTTIAISETGEILVRGDTLFAGYVHAETIVRPLTPDGWFATGDLGRFDPEGNLIVTGRKDNLFISGGENVQPEEIEALLGNIDGVQQAIVVPVPDDEFGARPVAFIRMEPDRPLEPASLADALASHLPRFKMPIAFRAWPREHDEQSVKANRSTFIELARRPPG